jgi:hypothetical protein
MKAIKRWLDYQDERWTYLAAILTGAMLVLWFIACMIVAGLMDDTAFSIFNR